MSHDIDDTLDMGRGLFQAGQYDRAYDLLAEAGVRLIEQERAREVPPVLEPFLAEPILAAMTSDRVGGLCHNLATYCWVERYERAFEFCEQAIVILREHGQVEGEVLGKLGDVYARIGQIDRAIDLYEQERAVADEVHDYRGHGIALDHLGTAYALLGQVERAIEMYEQALDVARGVGNHHGEATAHKNLGAAYASLGQEEKARPLLEKALQISEEARHRRLIEATSAALRALRV